MQNVPILSSGMALRYFKKLLLDRSYQIIIRKSHTEIVSVSHEVSASKSKLEKDPFMKNVFLGVIDKDMLYFPETEIEDLEHSSITDKLPQLETKAITSIGKDTNFIRFLQSGICGLGLPKNYGGVPLGSSVFLREIEKHEIAPDTSVFLEMQSVIIKIILNYGSEFQKQKYVKDLISGALIGAYAIHEEKAGSDPPSIDCTAAQVELSEKSSFVLKGEKTWIANASKAKFFIVFAQYEETNRPTINKLLSAFIVDRDTPGITIKENKNLVNKNLDICDVKFDNVVLPQESLIGKIGDGYGIAASILETSKFIFASSITTLVRRLLSKVAVQMSQTSRYPIPLRDYELVNYNLSKVNTTLYALESSVYFLAGMRDLYEIDTSLESVIVQNLLHSFGLNAINECINIAGSRVYDNTFAYQTELDNLQLVFRAFSTPEILKFYIALKGLEFATTQLSNTVMKLRNPFNYPSFIFKRMWNLRGQASDSPKLIHQLYMQYHPTLKPSANILEYSICRFQYCVECLLSQHGTNIVNRQLDLIRLSNIASDIFAMVAVLGRASRSYCTGIRYYDQEVMAANAWFKDALKRIKMNVSEILGGKVENSDSVLLALAPDILQNKGYFFACPMEKNIT